MTFEPMQGKGRPRPKTHEIEMKASDDVLRGTYSNVMRIAHTKEEFVLDFMNLLHPPGTLNARVIVSPGHLKRMVSALADNLRKYEAHHGPLRQAEPPKLLEMAGDSEEGE